MLLSFSHIMKWKETDFFIVFYYWFDCNFNQMIENYINNLRAVKLCLITEMVQQNWHHSKVSRDYRPVKVTSVVHTIQNVFFSCQGFISFSLVKVVTDSNLTLLCILNKKYHTKILNVLPRCNINCTLEL